MLKHKRKYTNQLKHAQDAPISMQGWCLENLWFLEIQHNNQLNKERLIPSELIVDCILIVGVLRVETSVHHHVRD